MKIGIIGAGNVGRGVTRLVIGNGHQVVLSNSHGPDTLSALVAELGPDVTAGTVADAAREDIVVLAVPWAAVPDAVAGLPAWNARIVVDATNHFVRADDGIELADLGGRTSSEVVAGLLPGARVVKAFNSLPVRIFERDPREAGGNRALFVSGWPKSGGHNAAFNRAGASRRPARSRSLGRTRAGTRSRSTCPPSRPGSRTASRTRWSDGLRLTVADRFLTRRRRARSLTLGPRS
jgi:predicted dinucleotide-binding enzyme